VTTDEPRFDSETVTLMDFRVPQRGEARFVYTLPTSATSALVELTSFCARAEPSAMAADLRQHLDRIVGAGCWTVVGDESGSLPLRLPRRRRRHGRQLTIGGAAGLVKGSTGYGVRLMERDAEVVASELATGRTVRGLRRRRRHAWMDAVFLELATAQPGQLVRALEMLFARNDIERVIRFLQEESTLVDEARIVATLPAAPFLRAVLQRGLGRP
jgi:lycopene beta-cyclase